MTGLFHWLDFVKTELSTSHLRFQSQTSLPHCSQSRHEQENNHKHLQLGPQSPHFPSPTKREAKMDSRLPGLGYHVLQQASSAAFTAQAGRPSPSLFISRLKNNQSANCNMGTCEQHSKMTSAAKNMTYVTLTEPPASHFLRRNCSKRVKKGEHTRC